ncbi:MAG: AraC family transcriptional regulator [Clostridia bacterium]|nr:AraC family transcriptional regulator [Clostridia bacterium]
MRYSVTCAKTDLLINPINMGYSDDTSVTRFGPGVREQYIIHFVTKGRGYFNGNEVKAGEGFLITPGTLEEYHCDPTEPWTFLWFICYGDDMAKIFKSFNANEENGIFTYDFVPEIEAYFDFLTRNCGKIIGAYEMNELFYSVVKHLEKSGEDRVDSSRVYLDYAVELIQREYSGRLTVSDICEKIGISEPYLFRLFKKEFGKSPKRYISDLRITQSKILLARTDMTVSEIASAVGFDDVLAFSKFFSLNTKKSPTAYRSENLREKR